MKKSPYSPDEFMSGLYGRIKAEPYKNADSYEDALKTGKSIKEKAMEVKSTPRRQLDMKKLQKKIYSFSILKISSNTKT